MPPLPISDEDLWNAFRKGDNSAFEELYRRHFEMLYRYGWQLAHDHTTVEESIQALFVYVYQHRSTLGEARSVRFYLLRSLRRLLAKESHNAEHFSHYDDEEALAHEIESHSTTPEITSESNVEDRIIADDAESEQRTRLQAHLQSLPPRQREVLHLFYFQELERKEIAEAMGVEIETVYILLHRALKSLRAVMTRT
jgi:RNA polymerase sigma factor (sigma-70 family)